MAERDNIQRSIWEIAIGLRAMVPALYSIKQREMRCLYARPVLTTFYISDPGSFYSLLFLGILRSRASAHPEGDVRVFQQTECC